VKHHLTGFGVSALLHGAILLMALPLMLWQDKLGKVDEPQPVSLSLAQFQPAPQPTPAEPPPKPEPVQPPPKPEPPKPEKKPVEKPKPEKKPVEKPISKPKTEPKPEHQHEPPLKPEVQPEPKPVAAAPVAPAPRPQQTPDRAPPAQMADNKVAEAAYRARLQGMIAARKSYPSQAEDDEAEGTVMVSFTVFPNGSITGARVSKSSGNQWLDKSAVQAVNAVSGALPFPPDIRKAQWTFSLAVKYQLE
jgi:protein TonB